MTPGFGAVPEPARGRCRTRPDVERRTEAPDGCRRQTQNKVEEITGDAKERIGGATGDDELRREGERDQSEANLKQAGEKVKDAFTS